MIVGTDRMKKAFLELKNTEIPIRCMSEISKENYSIFKDAIPLVENLRHTDQTSGCFICTDSHCIISSLKKSSRPMSRIIVSNIRSLVNQQQCLFDALWDKAIDLNDKINEIEKGKELQFTETILEPVKVQNQAWEMIKSARKEVLVILSSSKGFVRQEHMGSVELIKKLCKRRKNLKIKILTPKTKHVEEVRSQLKGQHYNIDIGYIQEFSQNITMAIADRKSSILVEVKNNETMNALEAIGSATYSTRVLTVLSYVSVFESFWTIHELYEESENELAYTKEYLNKVLNELDLRK